MLQSSLITPDSKSMQCHSEECVHFYLNLSYIVQSMSGMSCSASLSGSVQEFVFPNYILVITLQKVGNKTHFGTKAP